MTFKELVANLQEDLELALRSALAFFEAFALTPPSGKQNGFAAPNPPLFLAFRAGVGPPRNPATAFEKPLRPWENKAPSALSVKALVQAWNKFDRVHGPLEPEWEGALDLTEAELVNLPVVEGLGSLKQEAERTLRELLALEGQHGEGKV